MIYARKKILIENFFIKEKIKNIKFLKFFDNNLIKNHILKNYNSKNYYNNNVYWYLNNYINIDYHNHILFLCQYISDYYSVLYNKMPILTDKYNTRALVCEKNESIMLHNNIREYDFEDSPDLDLIYTVSTGKNLSFLTFSYENGRDKHKLYQIPLEENCYILFNSHLNRYITKNQNDDKLINLTLHFKLF